MSNGYLLAAEADLAAAHEIADAFGLDVIAADTVGSPENTATALAAAANVGILLSLAAAEDEPFVALMRSLPAALRSAQLILAVPEARARFEFLPQHWPSMSLDEARRRGAELARGGEGGSQRTQSAQPSQPSRDAAVGAGRAAAAPALPSRAAPATIPSTATPAPPPAAAAPTPQAPSAARASDILVQTTRPPLATRTQQTAPADATAFAPKKLRRGSPELVRIVIHQPKDLQAVIKAARKLDPRTDSAPSGMRIGDIDIGSSVGVALEVRGAAGDGALQRRTWAGEPLDFNFSFEPDADVKQAVFLARVFVNDAQIGVLAFTRPVGGASKKPHSPGDRVRLKRHKRVFLSYSSKDRATVAAIATAYKAAGVEHFFDRTSLKSGEEWSPRLKREIDRADLFHLCWSKSAAASQWVHKEAEHALTRRRRAKRPDITVQMLDGPPWAPHPRHLDSINFDDFVRAAVVGYARGDGAG
jgi:hypothetical protein